MQITQVLRQIARRLIPVIHVSDEYSVLQWILRLVMGSVTSILILQFIFWFVNSNTTYSNSTTQTTQIVNGVVTSNSVVNGVVPNFKFLSLPMLYLTIPVFVLFLLSPFFLSLIFTNRRAEPQNLRLVPPFAIGLATVAYGVLFLLPFPNPSQPNSPLFAAEFVRFSFGFLGLLSLGILSYGQDRLVVLVLGRTAEREGVYFEKIRIHGDIDEVKAKLLSTEVQDNLFLSERVDGDRKDGYLLKTRRLFDFRTRIGLGVDRENDGFTILKAAFYLRTRYSLSLEKYAVELTKKNSAYLRQVLVDRNPAMAIEALVPLTNSENDSFVSETIDDLRGLLVQTRRAPRASLVLGLFFIVLTALIGFVYISGQSSSGLLPLGIAIDVLIAGIALYEIASKRG